MRHSTTKKPIHITTKPINSDDAGGGRHLEFGLRRLEGGAPSVYQYRSPCPKIGDCFQNA